MPGSGRSRMALTTLNTAVLAAMPSASVTTMMAVNPGLLAAIRNVWRISCQRLSNMEALSPQDAGKGTTVNTTVNETGGVEFRARIVLPGQMLSPLCLSRLTPSATRFRPQCGLAARGAKPGC